MSGSHIVNQEQGEITQVQYHTQQLAEMCLPMRLPMRENKRDIYSSGA